MSCSFSKESKRLAGYPSTGYLRLEPRHFDEKGMLRKRYATSWPTGFYVFAEPALTTNVFGNDSFAVALPPWMIPDPDGPIDVRAEAAARLRFSARNIRESQYYDPESDDPDILKLEEQAIRLESAVGA